MLCSIPPLSLCPEAVKFFDSSPRSCLRDRPRRVRAGPYATRRPANRPAERHVPGTPPENGLQQQLEQNRDRFAMHPSVIAEAIVFAIQQPAAIDVNEIIVRSTAQP